MMAGKNTLKNNAETDGQETNRKFQCDPNAFSGVQGSSSIKIFAH